MQREQTAGVVGSLLFHACVGLLLFFWVIPEPRDIPEFVELSWGTSAVVQSPGAGSQSAALPAAAQQTSSSSSPVALPERRTAVQEEQLTVPRREKLDVSETPGGVRPSPDRSADLRRDRPRSGAGTQSAGTTQGTTERAGEGLGQGPGTSAGSGVSMAMEWSGGGTRRKLSGALPVFPPGEKDEAQIKIQAVVTPGGRVESVQPLQKGNARMEAAAMKEVRVWTFEPLPPGVAQRNQTCLITFNFRLR